MAVSPTAAGDYLTRAASFDPAAGPWTVGVWVYHDSTAPPALTQWVWWEFYDGIGPFLSLQTGAGTSDVQVLLYDGNVTFYTSAVFTVPDDTWVYFTIGYNNAATVTIRCSTSTTQTLPANVSTFIWSGSGYLERIFQGGQGIAGDDGVRAAFHGVWPIHFSLSQTNAQRESPVPIQTATAFTALPTAADLSDSTGNGHAWTVGTGSVTTAFGPIPPANNTPATGVVISSLPYLATQDLVSGGITYETWYRFPAASSQVVGLWGYGDFGAFNPRVRVYDDPTAGADAYLDLDTDADRLGWPIQFPVAAGTTYYLRFTPPTDNPDPAVLTVDLIAGPTGQLVAETLVVNDDTEGFPTAFIHPTSGAVIQFLVDTPAGESGDATADGTRFLLADDFNDLASLYDVTGGVISFVTTVDTGEFYEAIRTHNSSNTFYIAYDPGGGTRIGTVSRDGVIGGTTWNVGVQSVRGLAVNAAQTIAYFTNRTFNTPTKRWDLVNDVALPNLAGSVGAGYFTEDILVLADDTILVVFGNAGAQLARVRRYDPAGAQLNEYGPYSVAFPSGTQPRIAYAQEDPDTFWLWQHLLAPNLGQSSFIKIDVGTGATLQTATLREYEVGIYNDAAAASLSIEARFGNSFSCPLFALRGTTPPAPVFSEETERIRRLRRMPVLHHEDDWIFHQAFQLDLQTGIGRDGAATLQGHDPQVMLRWSNNGGRTWSNEHWVSAGKIGQYRRRAMWRRLGRARNRVYEVVVSDPNAWNLLAAYLAVEGES